MTNQEALAVKKAKLTTPETSMEAYMTVIAKMNRYEDKLKANIHLKPLQRRK